MSQTIQLRSHSDALGNAQSQYDAATSETVQLFSTVTFGDDFIGPGHSAIPAGGSPAVGYPWCSKIQKSAGSPTVAVVANFSGGAVACALDATSEKQEATLYANDELNWDMTKCAIWEARINPSVLPTGNCEAVFGLMSAWIDGPDNNAYYARFQMSGNGDINMQTKDGVNTISASTGIVAVAGTFHLFRIDATDPTNVRFFIDGAEVSNPKQLSFAATGANAVLEPYCTVYKASGVGVGTLQLDKVDLGMNRL